MQYVRRLEQAGEYRCNRARSGRRRVSWNWREQLAGGGGSFRRMTSPAPCQNTRVEGSLGHPVGALSVLRVTDTSRPDQFTFNPGLFLGTNTCTEGPQRLQRHNIKQDGLPRHVVRRRDQEITPRHPLHALQCQARSQQEPRGCSFGGRRCSGDMCSCTSERGRGQ